MKRESIFTNGKIIGFGHCRAECERNFKAAVDPEKHTDESTINQALAAVRRNGQRTR